LVVSVAVRLVRRLAERRDAAVGRPAAHMVAGHVGEGQVLLTRVPDRALGEGEAGPQFLQFGPWSHDGGWAAHLPAALRMSWTLVGPTNQSFAPTSSNTTQTSSLVSPVTSTMASVTFLASFAFLPEGSSAMTSLTTRILTNGMRSSLFFRRS